MHLYSIANRLQSVLPRLVWEAVRKSGNALLGPLNFSIETGHLRSSMKSLAMDARGDPLPWYTYSAIQFLLTKNYTERRVLEWGAGQSSMFWSNRAREVVSFEADRYWFDWISQRRAKNNRVFFVKRDISDVDELLQDGPFDVIAVDGLDRWKCAKRSIKLLTTDGVLIFDNLERYCDETGRESLKFFRETGFSRIDFYGYSPGNATQQCTSIFFKDSCFLIRGDDDPRVGLAFWKQG